MGDFEVTTGLAFLAGLASFLSPCVFSLVPVYIGYLSGRAVGGEAKSQNRWVTFSHGLVFVLGFSLVFILFNILAATMGGILLGVRSWLAKVGGVIVVIFGLHMIGVFRIPFLEYDVRVHSQADPTLGVYFITLDGSIFFRWLGALRWANPWVHHDFCSKRRFHFQRSSAWVSLFCWIGNPIPAGGSGHWLGKCHPMPIQQCNANYRDCNGSDAGCRRDFAFSRFI